MPTVLNHRTARIPDQVHDKKIPPPRFRWAKQLDNMVWEDKLLNVNYNNRNQTSQGKTLCKILQANLDWRPSIKTSSTKNKIKEILVNLCYRKLWILLGSNRTCITIWTTTTNHHFWRLIHKKLQISRAMRWMITLKTCWRIYKIRI